MKKPIQLLLLSSVIALASCTREARQPAPTPLNTPASIQDLMTAMVDPAADTLWESVSSELTAKGIEEKQPHTDAEWLALRHQAILLQEAANLLLMPGRAVTHADSTLR